MTAEDELKDLILDCLKQETVLDEEGIYLFWSPEITAIIIAAYILEHVSETKELQKHLHP